MAKMKKAPAKKPVAKIKAAPAGLKKPPTKNPFAGPKRATPPAVLTTGKTRASDPYFGPPTPGSTNPFM